MTQQTRRLGQGCWCGSQSFAPASNRDYLTCTDCGTLVLRTQVEQGPAEVEKALKGFYEAAYWNEHMDELGFPRIEQRARLDLAERCQFWLRATLRYVSPGARFLELGCAHGGFVKLLAAAGYAASGMEMSAEIVEQAKQMFAVDTHVGPLESSALADRRFEAIALFDVLEHFPDPEAVLRTIVRCLTPGGVLIVQTPETRGNEPQDWDHFKPPEHIFLFTRRAMLQLFERVGLVHAEFEPAIYPYDMFVFASAKALNRRSPGDIEAGLLATPDGRLVLAQQDLYALITQQQDAHKSAMAAIGAECTKLAGDVMKMHEAYGHLTAEYQAICAAVDNENPPDIQRGHNYYVGIVRSLRERTLLNEQRIVGLEARSQSQQREIERLRSSRYVKLGHWLRVINSGQGARMDSADG